MNAVPGSWFTSVGRCLVLLLLVFGVEMVLVGCGPEIGRAHV